MSEEGKDHYIPVFYLSQWATSPKGELCQYSRPHKDVVAKPKAPTATGFMHGLYSVPGLPPEKSRYIETELMQKLDSKAARAFQAMPKIGTGDVAMSEELSTAWATFLYGLILRVPQTLTVMQKQLDDLRAKFAEMSVDAASITDAEGVEHTVKVKHRRIDAREALPTFLAPGLVMQKLVTMQWRVKSIADARRHTMLTSDRPVIMTNGLAKPDDHLAIPLSPTILFVATWNRQTFGKIDTMGDDLTVKAVNSKVAEQAHDYVYGVDDRQLRFVMNRLGRRVQSTPLG
jgi:hypothetical protein